MFNLKNFRLTSRVYDFKVDRTEWVLQWPGQIVIAGCQTFWTTEVSESLEDGNLTEAVEHFKTQVHIMRICVMKIRVRV